MKILFVNVTHNQGSTGKIVRDLFDEYNRLGHETAVCYGRGPGVTEAGIYKFTTDFEVSLHALKTRATGFVGAGNGAATARLLRYIGEFKPDVVHLHNIHGYYVDAYKLLEYLKQNKILTVLTMHDEWVFTGKCGYSYDCGGWLEGCGSCPRLKEYPKSLFFDRTSRELSVKRGIFSGFDNIFFAPVAHWLMEKAKRSPFLSDKRFEVVHNGIDTDIFKPGDASAIRSGLGLEDKKILLHVTPNINDPRKGGKYALELANRLLGENAALAVVGAGPESSPKAPKNAVFIPRTENRAELAKLYSMADGLLLTSEMECLPTVCLESICCGAPVIGFDRGGAKEAAPPGHGAFVKYGDMDALETAARGLLFSGGGLGLKTREERAGFGRERYGKELMANRYLKLYEDGFK